MNVDWLLPLGTLWDARSPLLPKYDDGPPLVAADGCVVEDRAMDGPVDHLPELLAAYRNSPIILLHKDKLFEVKLKE
jgi:hypothetical protein